MKRIFKIICLTLLISSNSFSQNQKIKKNHVKYFDINYKQVSKKEFNKIKKKNLLLSIQGDSIHHRLLSVRESRGAMDNRKIIDSLLGSITSKKIDAIKTIAIIYYPGKDPCNSSGTSTRITTRDWYNKMEKGINDISESTILYIYKEIDGLYENNDGFKEWYKDADGLIGKLFFKYHYPCSSFVVISKKGEFISYFGEFPKDYIWNAVEILNKK